jgi:hypothetical protein
MQRSAAWRRSGEQEQVAELDAGVFEATEPFEHGGRIFHAGDLIIARPGHPDPMRRFVVESALAPGTAMEMLMQHRKELSPLGVVPSSSSSSTPTPDDPSPLTDRRQRADRRRGMRILLPALLGVLLA